MTIKPFISPLLALSLATMLTLGLVSCDGDKAETLLSIVEDGERGLSSIVASKANVTLAVGESTHLSVRAILYSRIESEFTEPVHWVSLDSAVATASSSGKITAVSEGTTEIQVSWSTYSASTNVTVNEAALQSIELSSPGLEIDACRAATLNATGTYSDGTSRPLRDSVNGLLADTTLGSIEIDPDSSITIESLEQGSTRLDVSVGNILASIPVVVLDTLAGITITPDLSALTPGEQVTLAATGNYNDGSESDISASAQWKLVDALPDESIAELDFLSFDPKILDALDFGTAVLEVTCGGIIATAPLAIAPPPVLESLQLVNGTEVELNAGEAVSLEILGVYTNGRTEDLSLLVGWTLPADDPGPFTLSTSETSSGVVTADPDVVIEQSTVATASYEGLSAATTVYVNRRAENTLRLMEVTLVDALGNESATLAGNPYILEVGDTVQLHVDAVYLTGRERIPDADVSWSNADPSIATVNGLGRVSALAAGQTTISTGFGGQSFLVSVSVEAAAPVVITPTVVLESLQLVNGTEVELNAGEAVNLEVLGVYTDGGTEDLSLLVGWTLPADDPGPFTLSTSETSTGVVTADPDIVIEQSTVATASYEGLTAATTVYAERGVEDTLQSLEVTLVDALGNESVALEGDPYIMDVGDTVQLHVDAIYLTGRKRIPDADVFWSNADPSIATVDGRGLVSAFAAGQAVINTIFDGQTYPVSLSVVVPD